MTTPTIITVDGVEYAPVADLPLVDNNDPLAVLVGHPVFVRTVTMHYTGRLAAVTADTLILDDAAWITDSGRFGDALAKGTLAEVEPFPGRVFVARGALVDVTRWDHDLPREQW